MSRFLQEFWTEGYRRTAPGFPLGLTRIAIGLFWLCQLESAFPSRWLWVLTVAAGGSLFLGSLTRLGALAGTALTVLRAVLIAMPCSEPVWPYALLIVVHVLLLVTHSGQNWGLDQVLMTKLANWPYRRTAWIRLVAALL